MFGKLLGYTENGQEIQINFEKNIGYIEVVSSQIIKVYANFDGIKRKSKSIEGNKAVKTEISVEGLEHEVIISTDDVKVHVFDNFKVDFYDKHDNKICADYRGERQDTGKLSDEAKALLEQEGHKVDQNDSNRYKIEVVKEMDNIQNIYGLGDKTGILDKTGYEYEMWNTDDPAPQVECFKALYKSIPFFIALTNIGAYGIFVDSTYHSYFNMGKENSDYYYFASNEGDVNYYYIAGESMARVIFNYTYLTGRAPVPQLFTLGYQQSRWSYSTEEEIRNIASLMREYKIPCDTIHLDIDYMDKYKVFTWNKDNYLDSKKMIKDLNDNGFKIVTIIDPGVKVEKDYYVYEEGKENNYFAKKPDGDIYENVVWPGDSVYPDFGKEEVRKWWGNKHKYLIDMGVRGIWNDMNEPASFNGPLPEDVVFSDEDRITNHAEMHNVYGHLMAKATYNALKEIDGRRPFIITRACFSGTQKYSTAWTGDNHSIWTHIQMAIPQQCNLSLSGMPNVGTDVGGFSSDCTPELMARWVQLGCFSPLFRNHSASGTRHQEPWKFDESIVNIYREYVELRYKLIPYYYDLFYLCESSGLGIIRPLVLNYTDDKNVRNLNDEFMVGDNILVSPVVTPGQTKKCVYLPEGDWYDYHSGKKYNGSQYVLADAPIQTCPIYVKAGSVLPNYPVMQYIGEKKVDYLILDVYKGNGTYVHYLDDGESFKYREGIYNKYVFTQKDGVLDICLEHAGYGKEYKGFIIKYEGNERTVDFNNSLTIKL